MTYCAASTTVVDVRFDSRMLLRAEGIRSDVATTWAPSERWVGRVLPGRLQQPGGVGGGRRVAEL